MYKVIATKTFERRYKKLLALDSGLKSFFATALNQLEEAPRAGRASKKLVGVPHGDGAWRLRLGRYRLRYDISGKTVTLHTIALRKDIYQKK